LARTSLADAMALEQRLLDATADEATQQILRDRAR
jgi:hypothetical protein